MSQLSCRSVPVKTMIKERNRYAQELLFMSLAFLFLAFDFRRDAESTAAGVASLAQYLIFGGTIISVVLFVNSSRHAVKVMTAPYFLICVGYVFYIYAVAYFNGVPGEMAKSTYPPYLCLLMGVLVGAGSVGLLVVSTKIEKLILLAGCVSVVFRLVYAVLVMGIDVGELRWQAGTAFSTITICVAIVLLLLKKDVPYLAVLALTLWSASAILQATRTVLITLLLIFIACGVKSLFGRSQEIKRRFIVRSTIVFCCAICGLFIAFFTFPDRFDRWGDRFSEKSQSGQILTLMSRFYDSHGLIDGYGSDPVKWVFGTGVGSTHYFHVDALQDINELGGSVEVYEGTTIAVHNVIINALKTGGLIGVGILLIILIPAYRSAFSVFRSPVVDPCSLPAMMSVTLIASLPSFMLGDPFFDRAGGFIVGFTIGCIIYFRAFFLTSKNSYKAG